ncbi:hypothetical protein [Candidatus Clostridium radicumherbarum]|uniref:DUF3021 domain-containing protein n=1 Tax=Candidatus Clostridium radicumherbarum TaxID=3381662 RepID=A0ABW8TTX3_9CLOT
MKKFMGLVFSIKAFASMIFTGLILAYMAAGWLYSTYKHVSFIYTVPLIFIVQALILALAISILWYFIFTDAVFKKLRYSIRLMGFVLLLILVLTGFLMMFFAHHTNWAKLWLIVAGFFVCITAGISILGEFYFRITGKRYTEILEKYKEKMVSEK